MASAVVSVVLDTGKKQAYIQNSATVKVSDEVIATLGLESGADVNKTFDKVSELYQHWWSVLHGQTYSYWEDVKTVWTGTYKYLCIGSGNLQYSKQINISSEGKITLANPVELACDYSLAGVKKYCETLISQAPVYITKLNPDDGLEAPEIMYIPSGATYYATTSSFDNPNNTTIYGVFDEHPAVRLNAQAPEAIRAKGVSSQLVSVPAGATTYEHSIDRNAYPDSGTVDGLTYKYLGVPFDNARIGSGVMELTYKGSSSCGSSLSKPAVSLVFERAPRIVFISCLDTTVAWCEPILIRNDENFQFAVFYGLDSYATMTAHYYSDTKTLKWYCSSNSANNQVGYDRCMNYNRTYTVKYLY